MNDWTNEKVLRSKIGLISRIGKLHALSTPTLLKMAANEISKDRGDVAREKLLRFLVVEAVKEAFPT